MVQINVIYFTDKEAEIQILLMHTVVWLQSLCFFDILKYIPKI